MNRMWKAGLAIAAVLALAGTAAGLVAAQEDAGVPGGDRLNSFIERLAGNLGISQEELEAAIDQTQLEGIDEALANGNITEEQAADARARIESGEGGIFGPLIRHGHRMHGVGFAIGMHALDAYADAAGITKAELVEAWQGEGALGAVLTGLGVDTDAVTAQIVADAEARLTENGVDQERIDEAVANTTEKLNELLASEDPPERRWGHGGFGGFPGGGEVTETVAPTF